MSNLCRQRILKNGTLAAVSQFILALTMLNVNFALVCATLSPEVAVGEAGSRDSFVEGSATDAAYYGLDEKRSWQSLQGGWGKRSEPADTDDEVDDEVFLAERWMPMLVGNGERFDPLRKYSLVYLTNAATLNRLSNQRQNEDLLNDDTEASSDGILNAKRTWKNMNQAWGKRRQAPEWNKFRGAWGKREPGWNNLKGMWGKRKRSSKDWQKLHGGWGKRSQLSEEMN